MQDDERLTVLFVQHGDEAFRLALLLCGDRTRAEDVVADVFARLLERLRRGGVDNPKAYLRQAIVNAVRNGGRRRQLERREAERRSGDDRGLRQAEDDVVERQVMLQALRRLPRRQRTAVVLRYYEGLSEEQTAEAMGCRVGTVKSQVSRGISRLAAVLDDDVKIGG